MKLEYGKGDGIYHYVTKTSKDCAFYSQDFVDMKDVVVAKYAGELLNTVYDTVKHSKQPEYYTVEQAKQAEFALEPIKCPKCGYIGEISYDQQQNDYFCAMCGKWNSE